MKTETTNPSISRVCLPGYPEVSVRFEWAVTLTSLWVLAGLFLLYFLSLIFTKGIWWNSNMWLGMIFFSGVTGLGLSWLAVPPSYLKTDTYE